MKIAQLFALPPGMTAVAGAAFITVASDAAVLIIHFALAVGMTIKAGKLRVIGGVGMTFGAAVPFTLMVSGIDWKVEIIMNELPRRKHRGI